MQRIITTAAAVSKRILPKKWFLCLRNWVERTLGPTFVHMYLDDLGHLPPVQLLENYRATTVRRGDEMDYVRVIRTSLKADADRAWYRENFEDDPEYDPRNLIIVRKGDAPIAVAAAWQTMWEGQKIGLIHNVGVDSDFLGQGLGRAVTMLALHRLRERGFERALLATEDHRIPALSLYLSLGFRPVYFSWIHRWRWKRILRRPDLPTAVNELSD